MFEKEKRRQAIPSLGESLNFYKEDLLANERLSLSEHQSEMFFDKRENANAYLVGAFGMAGIMFCAGLALVGTGVADAAGELGNYLMLGCILLIPVAFVLERNRSRYSKDLDSSVIKLEGVVRLEMDPRNGYRMSIGDQAFKVEKEVYLSFKQGEPYQIFYTPGSKTLLSARSLIPTEDETPQKSTEDVDDH